MRFPIVSELRRPEVDFALGRRDLSGQLAILIKFLVIDRSVPVCLKFLMTSTLMFNEFQIH